MTGAAGFIGSHLGDALLDAGHDVVAVDSFTDYYPRERKERNAAGLDVIEADLATADLEPVLAGADGIFHLAGQPGVRASWGESFQLYLDRNVRASQRLFEAAAAAGVRVVFASSSSVYGDAESYPTPERVEPRPISPYGITKLACEHLAHAYASSFGLDFIVLRYFNAFGPRQRPDMAFTRIAFALAEGRPFDLYGDGLQSRSFTYVGDVVAASVAALGANGGVYNVGGGTETTMLETISIFERLAGRSLEVRRHPAVPGDQRRTLADTTRIRAELSWEPRVGLEEGLAAQWDWAAGRVAAP